MNKIIYIFSFLILIALISCSAEAPFEGPGEGQGRVLTSSIELEVKSNETSVRSSSNVPVPADFTIEFYKKGQDTEPVESFPFTDMPSMVILPVGEYYVRATYGGDYGVDKNAEFDKPYYVGETGVFNVEENKIVDSFSVIKCTLANVKVSISFSEELKKVMSNNATVTVRVGKSSDLQYDQNTTKDGFFKYDQGSNTLVATFNGEVEGIKTVETKQYSNVKPGNYYKITFKIHSIESDDPVVPPGPDDNPPDGPNNPPVGPDEPNNPPVGPDTPDEPVNPDDPNGNVTIDDNKSDDAGLTLDATVVVVDDSQDSDIDISEEDELLVDVTVPDNPDNNDPGNGEKPGENQPDQDNPGTGETPGGNTSDQDEPEEKNPDPVVTMNFDLKLDGSEAYHISDYPVLSMSIECKATFTKFLVRLSANDDDFNDIVSGFGGAIDLMMPADDDLRLELASAGVELPLVKSTDKKAEFIVSNFYEFMDLFGGKTFTFTIEIEDVEGGSTNPILKLISNE